VEFVETNATDTWRTDTEKLLLGEYVVVISPDQEENLTSLKKTKCFWTF
jgi:hypothetical protein